MIIMKFGGTSVGSSASISKIRTLVSERRHQRPVVVVSALSGVTNLIVELVSGDASVANNLIDQLKQRHHQVVNELWPNGNEGLNNYINQTIDRICRQAETLEPNIASDRLLSMGEILSSQIVSRYFNEDFTSEQFIASDFIITNDHHGSAEVINEQTGHRVEKILRSAIDQGIVPVVTGFIGATPEGVVTTLGRGGSDYTAALLGHYLSAEEIQIWTDVDGVMSVDPRVVQNARLITEMTYEEAAELAAFGAKVLHPKTMRPAIYSNIPIRIANTFNFDAITTVVQRTVDRDSQVVAVASKNSVVMVNIYAAEMLLQKGFLSRISAVFAKYGISIDIVSATEVSVSITLDNSSRLAAAITELEKFSKVTIHDDVGLVTLIGKDIAFSPALVAETFSRLSHLQVPTKMISVGAEGVNISLVVESSEVNKLVNSLHELFIEEVSS